MRFSFNRDHEDVATKRLRRDPTKKKAKAKPKVAGTVLETVEGIKFPKTIQGSYSLIAADKKAATQVSAILKKHGVKPKVVQINERYSDPRNHRLTFDIPHAKLGLIVKAIRAWNKKENKRTEPGMWPVRPLSFGGFRDDVTKRTEWRLSWLSRNRGKIGDEEYGKRKLALIQAHQRYVGIPVLKSLPAGDWSYHPEYYDQNAFEKPVGYIAKPPSPEDEAKSKAVQNVPADILDKVIEVWKQDFHPRKTNGEHYKVSVLTMYEIKNAIVTVLGNDFSKPLTADNIKKICATAYHNCEQSAWTAMHPFRRGKCPTPDYKKLAVKDKE
jgi:hypothetical protein